MSQWRRLSQAWVLWPAQPRAVIEMVGGSYLAASPQLSYRRLLEHLAERDLAVHAWSYVPGFDHQAQANQAWKAMRQCRQRLEARVGSLPPSIRLGHSLGCKLHLLAPDGGRKSHSLVSLSFNNFEAEHSIPMLRQLAPRLGIRTGFSPGPEETLNLITNHYIQPRNLLIRFDNDNLDQSQSLLNSLRARADDVSQVRDLQGDHLTPASVGLRRNLLGEWADDANRARGLEELAEIICNWSLNEVN